MELKSVHGNSIIRIDPFDVNETTKYVGVVEINGHKVTDDDLVLIQPAAVLSQLKNFEHSRTGRVVISGTNDFELTFESDGNSGGVWVWVRINTAFVCHSNQTSKQKSGHLTLEGGFSISGEWVSQMVNDFMELLKTNAA